MAQASWIKAGIALGNDYHFKKKRPLGHNLLNLGLLLLLLTATGAVIAGARFVHPALYIPLAGFALGVTFFTSIILVVHEASHWMFVISADKERAQRWNRFFGWAVSIPFAINYLEHWEKGHHKHHLQPVEDGDPQAFNLLTGAPLISMLLKMIFIPGYVFLWNPSRRYKTGRWLGPVSVAFWAAAGWAAWTFVAWSAAPALLLGLQVLGALNQLKGSMEHGGAIGQEENRLLRSRSSFFPLRGLIMPLNISLHFEHHLNFCVPWYELVRYHRALKALVPPSVAPEVFNEQVWEQLMGRKGALSEAARAFTVEPGS